MIKKRATHPRARGRIRVRFGLDTLDRTAFTTNVSETGAFVGTNSVFPPGRTIKVEFNIDDESVEFYARVIWAKKVPPQLAHLLPCGMGVRFIDPPASWTPLYEAWSAGKSTR